MSLQKRGIPIRLLCGAGGYAWEASLGDRDRYAWDLAVSGGLKKGGVGHNSITETELRPLQVVLCWIDLIDHRGEHSAG